MDAVAELERQLRHASFFQQASLEQQGQLVGKLDVYLTGLIELLLDKGLIDGEALQQAVTSNREEAAEATRARHEDGSLPPWPNVVVRDDSSSELPPPVEVDCEARMHICKAVCCTLPFALSAAEVEEGTVRWELGHPYMIRHGADGYCVHIEGEHKGCGVYDRRPSVCRGYSCAEDERIWSDFDNMVLNEEFLASRARPGFSFHPATTAVSVAVRPPRRNGRHGDEPPAAPADEMPAPEPVGAAAGAA
jgi:Fe-S-cluster containining protein